MIRAALFDMDGLLFDTEQVHMQAAIDCGVKHGHAITKQMTIDTLGVNEKGCSAYFKERFPTFDPETFWADFHQYLYDYVREKGMPLKPYCREILENLRANGVKLALVSSSQSSDINFYLDRTGLHEYFPVIISGDMGLKSKPEPDVYLRAAELLGVDIHECAVLEDSPYGLASGRSAGARTYMVPDLKPYTEEMAAITDIVVPTLKEACEDILSRVCR